jgi:hypothetical protein
MKNQLFRRMAAPFVTLALGQALLWAPLALHADAAQALTASAKAGLKILGDSTLHHWDVSATQMQISAVEEDKPGSLLDQVKAGSVSAVELTVTVEGLKSSESASMDKNMYKAMESSKFPLVRFSLKSYQIKDGQVAAKGVLSIHGVSKDVSMTASVALKDGQLGVKGSYDLLMSDYGIKPPVMMLGTVRVADKVSIVFDTLVPAKQKN